MRFLLALAPQMATAVQTVGDFETLFATIPRLYDWVVNDAPFMEVTAWGSQEVNGDKFWEYLYDNNALFDTHKDWLQDLGFWGVATDNWRYWEDRSGATVIAYPADGSVGQVISDLTVYEDGTKQKSDWIEDLYELNKDTDWEDPSTGDIYGSKLVTAAQGHTQAVCESNIVNSGRKGAALLAGLLPPVSEDEVNLLVTFIDDMTHDNTIGDQALEASNLLMGLIEVFGSSTFQSSALGQRVINKYIMLGLSSQELQEIFDETDAFRDDYQLDEMFARTAWASIDHANTVLKSAVPAPFDEVNEQLSWTIDWGDYDPMDDMAADQGERNAIDDFWHKIEAKWADKSIEDDTNVPALAIDDWMMTLGEFFGNTRLLHPCIDLLYTAVTNAKGTISSDDSGKLSSAFADTLRFVKKAGQTYLKIMNREGDLDNWDKLFAEIIGDMRDNKSMMEKYPIIAESVEQVYETDGGSFFQKNREWLVPLFIALSAALLIGIAVAVYCLKCRNKNTLESTMEGGTLESTMGTTSGHVTQI